MLSYFADFLLPGLLNKPTLSTWLATQLDALMANLLVDASSALSDFFKKNIGSMAGPWMPTQIEMGKPFMVNS